MNFNLATGDASAQRTGCVVVGVHKGGRLSDASAQLDKASQGAIARCIKRSNFDGEVGHVLMLTALESLPADRILLVGTGRATALDSNGFRKLVRRAAQEVVASHARDAVSYLGQLEVAGEDCGFLLQASAVAFSSAAYRFDGLKNDASKRDPVALKKVSMTYPDGARRIAQAGLQRGQALADGISLCCDLGNLPGNVCTPSYLADRARQIGRRHDKLSVNVKGEPEIKRMGMGAMLSVARGSREPPRLITMHYQGAAKSQKPIVLVGKGVTFDSGGISIKPSGSMDEMKYDMCGAASVLGVMEFVCQLGLPVNLVGIIVASENLPDGNAIKPGDIVTSMAGHTIEILNTDAEGRLLLCDALTYAERFQPDLVIDIATLTGACVIALGAHATGLFCNNDGLADALLSAGEHSGDRVWRMPVWSEYAEQLRSNFADLANVGGREAGAVTAACFLERFARDLKWAHLDIAGTAWRSGKAKGATGRPVSLLAEFVLHHKASPRRAARKRG